MARQYEGRRVVRSLAGILVLTAVVPPGAAYALASWRIARAEQLAVAAAPVIAGQRDALINIAGRKPVVAGPGRLPEASPVGEDWLRNPIAVGQAGAASWPLDPWGRCYLLDVRGMSEGAGLLISAGPNGTIDTPLGATAPSGDDIGALLR